MNIMCRFILSLGDTICNHNINVYKSYKLIILDKIKIFKLQIFAESLELIKKSLKIENKTNVNDKA
jgi:hypothetical protein